MPDGKFPGYLTMLLAEAEGYSPGLPDGVFFLEDESVALSLGEELCQHLLRCGYKRVFPPMFEFYDTYTKGGAGEISHRSFAFKDKDGSLLALRYDMTTPIARMVAQKYSLKDLPLRLFYYGDVFREQPFHQGKPRQMRQLGIEFIGGECFLADVETVEMAAELLGRMDEKYRLVVGDMRVYHRCLERLSLSSWQQEALHRCFQMKDVSSLKEVLRGIEAPKEAKMDIEALVDMIGDFGALDVLKERLQRLSFDVRDVVLYLDFLDSHFSPKQKRHLLIDLGMVKEFGYYTSLVLEGYISKSGYAVCHGGRYDNLYAAFGKDFSAVGFAFDLSYMFS